MITIRDRRIIYITVKSMIVPITIKIVNHLRCNFLEKKVIHLVSFSKS